MESQSIITMWNGYAFGIACVVVSCALITVWALPTKYRTKGRLWIRTMAYRNMPFKTKPPELPEIENVSEVLPGCVRMLALNPSWMTLQGTNTYLVGNGSSRLLIDTGEGKKSYVNLLRRAMRENGAENISDVLITHGHIDHIGGIGDIRREFPSAKVWVFFSPESTPDLDEDFCGGIKGMKTRGFSEFSGTDCVELGFHRMRDGQKFRVEGATIQVLHTPGHTHDSVSFVWKERNAVFTGDTMLGHGSTVFQHLLEYMASLKTLRDLNAKFGLPGHGEMIRDLPTAVQELINHRSKRESQIISVIRENPCITTSEIVKLLYPSIPTRVVRHATKAVLNHLDKLNMENTVTSVGPQSGNRWKSVSFFGRDLKWTMVKSTKVE